MNKLSRTLRVVSFVLLTICVAGSSTLIMLSAIEYAMSKNNGHFDYFAFIMVLIAFLFAMDRYTTWFTKTIKRMIAPK